MNKQQVQQKNLISEKEYSFAENQLPFSKFFKYKLNEYNDIFNCKLSKDEIAEQLGISKSLIPKYIANGDKATKKRDCVIAMCMMVHMSVDDINIALQKYNMSYLDSSNKRDAVIINLIQKNAETVECPLTFDELNEYLYSFTGTYFDIIDHRGNKKDIFPHYPYTLLKKRVECRTDDLVFGNPYDSLINTYSKPHFIYAFMWLDDNGQNRFKLCAESDGHLSCTEYSNVGKIYHKYENLEETGIFKSCFSELLDMALKEKRRMADILNETRNYQERISAKVINNDLHVFYETYNYSVPELDEYYLMDYVNGEYTLYVSHISRFMRFYLSKEEYNELYTKFSDKVEETYTSIEQIEKAVEESKSGLKEIIKLRVRAFCKAQEKINTLIDDLKNNNAHIRNLEKIFDNPYDVLRYYGVTDDFQCSYDAEFGEINGFGVDKPAFTISDGSKVELSIDHLSSGFRLGLNSIEEIGAFFHKNQTLEIKELFEMGLKCPKND